MIMDKKLCAACVALAVFALVTAVPQGMALAGGMDVKTADLCNVVEDVTLFEFDSEAIGTVAAVTDKRNRLFGGNSDPWTAWAVSLEGMRSGTTYDVWKAESGLTNCNGVHVYTMPPTDINGEAYQNIAGTNPVVGDVIQICRDDDGLLPVVLIPILEGVLVKGGKERNKPNRC